MRRPSDPVLVALLVATGLATPAFADRARILASDNDAAEARVALALGAERELFASAYVFGDDPFTLTSLGLLRETARRGVAVKPIVDAQWNRIPRVVQAHLLAQG